jgi:signal transduction histidine kinase
MDRWSDEQPARLLLVDDRPENLLALEAVLLPLGHEIHRASSAGDALRLALTYEFAVILLDVQMPGTDGLATARLLKERRSSAVTPIIFLTAGDTDPRAQFTGYAAGAVDYMAKPFDPEVLRAKIEVFVELFRARDLNRREHSALVAEQVARTSAERARQTMEHLLEGMGDAFLGLDSNQCITYANRKAEEFLLTPRHTLLGMRVRAAIERVDPDVVVDELQSALDGNNGTCVELVFPTLRRTYEATIYTSPQERSLFMRNVTEQRTAEANLRSAEEKLQKAHKMEALGQFAGSIAHDFNNILAIITSCSDLLAQSATAGGEPLEDVREIRNAADRGAALVKQLMAFSRGRPESPSTTDVNRVVSDFAPLLHRLVGSSIRVSLVRGSDVPPVRLAPTLIEQILLNLAANARDSMGSGGILTIRTLRVTMDLGRNGSPGTYAGIVVTDTGSGMTDDMRARVFEAFFTTKGPGQGTGLGLATVHGIVEQAGGMIEVDSEVGRGTSFRIYLPATEESGPTGTATGSRDRFSAVRPGPHVARKKIA